MSNLVTTPKNGSLATRSKRMSNFPWMPSLFEDWLFGDYTPQLSANFNTGISSPKVNIRETGDAYFVEMAVPGMKKDDFMVNLDNQLLSIAYEVNSEEESTSDDFMRREFGYSSFKRSFHLPDSVNETQIKAHYRDGILSIEIPKKEEARKKPPRTIKIS